MRQHAIKPSPLFVIGMHRSGTTLVCKLLQDMGCFMGFRREENEESTFFRRFNDAILLQHGALWNHPNPFKQLLDNKQKLQNLSKNMQHKMHQLAALEYWGPLLRYGVQKKHPYWGWKDPRINIVLPVYLELFPNATIIQVVRNGVDVAASLHARDIRMRQENKKNLPPDYPSLMEDFQLWCDYLAFSEAAEKRWHGRYFTIRYEDLLASPNEIIQSICNHLSLPFSDSLSENINPTRKHAFLDKPELFELYQQVKAHPYMVKYNYHHIEPAAKLVSSDRLPHAGSLPS